MIYRAIKKDLGTGSITGNSQQSYVVPYYVITDNTEDPRSIYTQARSTNGIVLSELVQRSSTHSSLVLTKNKLPVFGEVTSTLHVSNISIDRVSENNLRAVPGYGLTALERGSYTCWTYIVTFSDSTTTWSTGSDAPWLSDTATSCSWSPKTYERYDNKTLVPNYSDPNDTGVVPNYPLYNEKYTGLQNTAGDDLYRSRVVYNYLLNFSYAVRKFDASFLPLYLNSMNLKDCVIAGIPIKKYHAVINDMKVSQAEWNDKTYYNVDVEIEVQYQERLTYDVLNSSGYRAYMLEGKREKIHDYLTNTLKLKAPTGKTVEEIAGFVYKYTNSNTVKKYPVPIHELTDTKNRDSIPDERWFSKRKNLGYFSNIPIKEKNTKVVPITRRVYLTYGVLYDGNAQYTYTIKIAYKDDPSATEITLYLVSDAPESDYGAVYSTVQGQYSTQNKQNLRYMRTGTMVIGDVSETIYYMTKFKTRPFIDIKESEDLLANQYDSIKEPVVLNKHGGLYLTNTESSISEDVTQKIELDMDDLMLGKVKDYQHVARDWTALAFPKKGMFWDYQDEISSPYASNRAKANSVL